MRGNVAVEGVSLRLGAFALREVDLALAAGEILVILGPNGAGKSVTLEVIAGFHRPQAGRIVIDGRDVTALAPERRRIGLMVQSFGLFPHMTVARNVAVGAGSRSRTERTAAIAPLLERFGIAHLARRRPDALSPGEKQRVALARALAACPDLFLFDEPFSALDARTSEALREELAQFLRSIGVPAIFVTHDRADAFILADRIAVMDGGRIVQSGAPDDIFQRPATRRIAEFVGIENVIPGRLVARTGRLSRIEVGPALLDARSAALAEDLPRDIVLCIRAEDVVLHAAPSGTDRASVDDDQAVSRLSGRVVAVTELGALSKVRLDCGFPLTACLMTRTLRELGLAPGRMVAAEIPADAVHLLSGSGPCWSEHGTLRGTVDKSTQRTNSEGMH